MKVAFTGDVCGQGWGIDAARGGLKMFETMRAAEPDLFIHLGDTIYADNPIERGGEARRRHAVEERDDRGEIARRPNDRRFPRRRTATTCSTKTCGDSTRRRASSCCGTITRRTTTGSRREGLRTSATSEQSSALLSARARAAFLEYQPIRQFARDRERIYRTQRFGPLLGSVRLGHAELSRARTRAIGRPS